MVNLALIQKDLFSSILDLDLRSNGKESTMLVRTILIWLYTNAAVVSAVFCFFFGGYRRTQLKTAELDLPAPLFL